METYEEILGRMQGTFEELAGYPADDASDIGIRLRVLAGEVYSLTAAMDWLEQQFFAQTAQDEQLDLRAQEHGIQRRPAQAAAGELTFSRAKPLWYRAVIDKGTVCALPGEDGARYVTTEEAVLAVGSTSVTVPTEAEQPGRDGNAAAGTVTTLITVPPGIEQVTNQKPFTGGADAEGDESLRARLTQSYAALPNGTNAAFYRNQALKDEGVFSANVVPKEQGLGTVGVYLGASGAAADSETIQRVQAMFDELTESVEESAEEAKKTAISDFFGKLNSPMYGSILDSLLVVEQNLANARKIGVKMPPQLMSLTIIFKQLIRFVKDSGIEPIEEVGREFEASYEDISLLNYVGAPYERDGEIKKLRVSTPGWKYGEIIISTPTVQEVAEE